jgi:predicted Rossmann fold flavoprotein
MQRLYIISSIHIYKPKVRYNQSMMKDESLSPCFDLAVVGGGAAGFFAAIVFAEAAFSASGKLPQIVILERGNRPLGKVLASGGGRCNLTHACFDPALLVQSYPRGGAELRGAFTRFQPSDTIAWFEAHGVPLKTEPDGRIFPVSDSAQSVVDCLQESASQAGVELRTKSRVEGIDLPVDAQAPFLIRLRPGGGASEQASKPAPLPDTLAARYVLLATGGEASGFRMAADLGHALQPPVPSLFTFNIPDPRLEGLAGLSVQDAALKLVLKNAPAGRLTGLEQSGDLLITHWGLSGPVVLRLSAWGARELQACAYQAELLVNWLGSRPTEKVLAFLRRYKEERSNASKKIFAHHPFHQLPLRLWKRLAQSAGVEEKHNWGDLPKTTLTRLAEQLTRGAYAIRGKGPFKEEFVTCGGVRLDQVNFKTMESRLLPGLYFAGEVLDVDGLTGGFNFQNAWTTGWIAGNAVAQKIKAPDSGIP